MDHATENEAVLPVDLAIEVCAKALRCQVIEQRFERVRIVVAEGGQHGGLPGAAHRGQAVGQRREELPLAVEAAAFGQQVTGDQDEPPSARKPPACARKPGPISSAPFLVDFR